MRPYIDRRLRRPNEATPHPDVSDPDVSATTHERFAAGDAFSTESAVEFVAIPPLVQRMRIAFFRVPSGDSTHES